MYYLLHYAGGDEKKDMSFKGTIYDQKKQIVESIFDDGKKINEKSSGVPFKIILDEKQSKTKKRKPIDKIYTFTKKSGNLFLVSPKAVELFIKLKVDNVQYFDVTIQGKDIELTDYKIVNIIDKIECVDFKKSEVETYDDGDLSMMTSLVLNEKKIPKNKKVFLLGPRATGIIVMHEELKKEIEKAVLTGFQFIDLKNAGRIY